MTLQRGNLQELGPLATLLPPHCGNRQSPQMLEALAACVLELRRPEVELLVSAHARVV